MNKLSLVILGTLFSISLVGCASSRSPVTSSAAPNTTGLEEGAIIGGSTAAGAGIGYVVSKGKPLGTGIGAVGGLVAGALVNNALENSKAQREAELMEAGRREERVRLETEYWEAERMAKKNSGASESPTAMPVNYQGGYFEGINLAPRKSGQADALNEPRRP